MYRDVYFMMFCAVLYMYISLTMHMHMHACIHNMENVSFNFQTLIFFNCHIWASTKVLCTRVWRTLVGKPNEKKINDCLFMISPDSQIESLANEMPSFWHSTAYAIEQRENVRYEAVHTATFNVDGIQWNVYCTSIAERQITNAVFSVVMLAQLQSFYSPIQS